MAWSYTGAGMRLQRVISRAFETQWTPIVRDVLRDVLLVGLALAVVVLICQPWEVGRWPTGICSHSWTR